MQTKYGFLKGLNQDLSPSKFDNNNYYDALNIRVVTDSGLSTGSITNELGNELLFSLPTNLPSIFIVPSQVVGGNLTIETSFGVITILLIDPSITGMYNTIMADATVISDIAAGMYKVILKDNLIYFIGLTDLIEVTAPLPSATELVTPTSNFKIIGMGTMRDWLVIFTTDPNIAPFGTSATGNGQIWKCQYDKVNGIINGLSGNTLVPATHLVYNGVIGFSAGYRVGEVISRYQDSTHGKIYFVDGNNTLKHINILDAESLALPANALDIIPDIDMSQPKVTSVVKGGLYKSGMVQYAYQLFNLGGSETTFSPASGLVHLTNSDEFESTTTGYKGTPIEGDTGKAVKILIEDIDTTFQYIRLSAIYYTSQEGAPVINVVSEKPVPTSGTITITDSGDTILDIYTATEYNAFGSRLIKPKTITTKNNLLIAGNIKEEYFDFDTVQAWDARAYRYKDTGGGTFVTFKADGVEYNDPTLIAETADAILTRAEQETYKYTPTGVLGGYGTNVSYEFVLTPIKIDSDTDDTKTFTDKDATNQTWSTKLDTTYIDNDSYTSYASPINRQQLVGYMRDEIYRFGIVLFDGKGRQSFVKWIADIKMPAIRDLDNKITYNTDAILGVGGTDMYDYNTVFEDTSGTGIYANILGVKFTVNNLPAGYKYRIVRVRREDDDKYILGQGLMGCTEDGPEPTTVTPYNHLAEPTILDTGDSYNNAANKYQHIVTFKSPEVLFTNSIKPIEGDIIELVALTDNTTYDILLIDPPTSPTELYETVFTVKVKSLTPVTKAISVIDDGIKAEDTYNTNSTLRYIIQNGGAKSQYLNHNNANKGTVLALGLKTVLTVDSVDKHIILNYTKDPSVIQYGGAGYYERINNTYIACSNLYDSTTTTAYVYGGDTFINMWEYLNAMLWTGHADKADVTLEEVMEVVYVPLESTINTELRHGSSFSKGQTNYKLCETVSLGNSIYPGADDSLGVYPAEYENVYQYNTVYSTEPTGKTFTPKPSYFQVSNDNDYRITVSEKNINGQVVDSWTKFLFNNVLEVTSAYGPINKLITHNNQVFFFQDNAYGLVSVNDRQLLRDETGSQLVLGTGGVLDAFKYVSEKAGCKSKFSVVDTGSALYFYDLNNRKFMKFAGGQDAQVSDVKGLSSFFKTFDYGDAFISDSNTNSLGVHGVFDPINNRVLYTFMGNEYATFSYSELLDAFESFFSFTPTMYQDFDGLILSVAPNQSDVYLHGSTTRGKYYGTMYPSSVTSLLAPEPDYKKVYTNLEFNSIVEDNGVEQFDETIDKIRLWTNYQDTGDITVVHPTSIRRRFRTWRYQFPKIDGSRALDYSALLKLEFTNTDTINRKIRLDDVMLKYLIPII